MLDYAARRQGVATRGSSPNALLMIIAIHVAALAALMSARMDLPPRIISKPLIVDLIHEDHPPPVEHDIHAKAEMAPAAAGLTQRPAIVPTPPTDFEITDSAPALPDIGKLIGPSPDPLPAAEPQPRPAPPIAAQLVTPASQLKPPYPKSKLLSEEQAVLKLRLTIDERGRVVAVAPIGRPDPAFLDAARRHIVAHWRYRPASEGGRAIASSAIITLHFELDG